MASLARASMASWFVLVIVGCSSSSSSPTGSGSSTGNSAQAVAQALCDRTQACAPALLQGLYGDVANCVTRVTATFAPGLTAKGSAVTAAVLDACASALPAASCGDLLSNRLPDACTPPAGTLADGAACAVDAQCATKHCKIALGKTCGTCAARSEAAGACVVATDCAPGLTCISGACAKLGTSGSACSATAPCRPDFVCRGGACAAPVAAGATCADGEGCDELHGVVCSAASKKCVNVTYGGTNAACGLVPSGLEVCAASGYCKGVKAPSYQGTCVAAAEEGAACDLTNGPYCNAGAVCVDGKCAVIDPAKCQ